MRTSVERLPSRLAFCGLLAGLTVARPAAGAASPTMALHVDRAVPARAGPDRAPRPHVGLWATRR